MTKEEILQTVTMTDLLTRYGLRASSKGLVCCPFHHEKTASMKIYRDNFHCFGCGADGDIFKFVQMMENCSFRDAFISLGGTYADKHESPLERQKRLQMIQRVKGAKAREQALIDQKKRTALKISKAIESIDKQIKLSKPLSDEWCYLTNKRFFLYMKFLELREEVSKK